MDDGLQACGCNESTCTVDPSATGTEFYGGHDGVFPNWLPTYGTVR